MILHGGHMRAGIAVGERELAAAGHTVLAPSRPGYGRTPVSTGPSPERFAAATEELCARLGVRRLDAVIGISGGGPTAVALAARSPRLVRRLVLESAVGPLPWPDLRTRAAGRLLFHPRTEALTWGATHALVRRRPGFGLRLLLGGLTTRPVGEVLAELDAADREQLAALLGRMRSGAGFATDLRYLAGGAQPLLAEVRVPALVVAGRADGAVPFAHAEALAAALPRARLLVSEAGSHLLRFGRDAARTGAETARFVTGGD
nr:alpha/beta fold hydrolase [Streptomyces sp. HNM0574]